MVSGMVQMNLMVGQTLMESEKANQTLSPMALLIQMARMKATLKALQKVPRKWKV